ncbi:MAG: O-antigen ligase family protein, partial [Phocaeicola sp.]
MLIWGIILCINKYKSCVRKKIRRCFFTIGITLLVVVLVSPIQSISGQIRNNTKLIYEKKCFKEQSEVIETVGRDDNTSDPSNRRFSIWKSGVEIWNTKPVFGVSWANLTNYAEKEVPNTYIVNNDLQNFSSLHNMVLDVLVGQGIIGIVLLGCININTLAFIIKNYKKLCGVNELLGGFFFTIMCISFFTSLFISSIFYINSPESYTFWFVFGGYMSI